MKAPLFANGSHNKQCFLLIDGLSSYLSTILTYGDPLTQLIGSLFNIFKVINENKKVNFEMQIERFYWIFTKLKY